MHRTTPTTTRLAAATTALVLALGLAACGDDDSGSPSPSAAVETAANGDVFNAADVTFATDMIPHHAQAIQMVTMTDGRPLEPQVKALADEIRGAQAPEVEEMTDWLTAWDQEVPATSLDHAHGGHGGGEASMPDGMSDMPGMMSEADMTELEQSSGEEFQTKWLELMKAHHEGAVEMAETEVREGRYPQAVALAKSIITTQQAEIERIDALLGS